MSTEEFNPFTSPQTDISEVQRPDPDEDFPLVPTTHAVISDVPPPYKGAARSLAQTLSRILAGMFVVSLSGCFVCLFLSGLPLIWGTVPILFGTTSLYIVLNKWFPVFGNEEQWGQSRMIQQLKCRPAPLFRADQEPYQFVTLTGGAPEEPRSFRFHWGFSKTLDIGLIRVDMMKREALLEADTKRYHMPRGCLWNCELREVPLESGNRLAVRLVIEADDGPHELHLLPPDIVVRQNIFGATKISGANPLFTELHRCLVPLTEA